METEQASELVPHGDPFAIFEQWFAQARESEPNDGNAMALATATRDGLPSVRMVLLKDFGPDGFVFYTNRNSRKGQQISENPNAALLFHWKSLRRQVRIEGPLSQVDDATADAYFASRSRDAQYGAVASDQSSPLESRAEFIERFEQARAGSEGRDVVRPPHWTGFGVRPVSIEFWHDRSHRLHERRLFTLRDGEWTSSLLYP